MSGKAFKRIGEKSTPESKEAVRKEIKAIMDKTKQEVISDIKCDPCDEYKCLAEELLKLDLDQFEIYNILNIVEKRLNQAYSAGFEACRNKVEEGVKKMRHESVQFGHIELVSKVEVLTTIKEVKE